MRLDSKRLSIDIDFNYVGGVEKEVMVLDRPVISSMLQRIFREQGYVVDDTRHSYLSIGTIGI
jgi:hypothetical protein